MGEHVFGGKVADDVCLYVCVCLCVGGSCEREEMNARRVGCEGHNRSKRGEC